MSAFGWPMVIAEGGFPSWLTPELQVLVWSLVIFFTLLALLWKFAWGPIMRALEEREHGIQKKIDDAGARFKEAEAKAAEYEKRLSAAKDAAAELLAQGKRDAEKIKQDLLAQANQEAGAALTRARQEIKLAEQAAVAEIRTRVAELAAEMAERVIEREVKPEDHRRFIAEAISKIEKQ
jgi:F-type H+-transporting ATPase subunit b